ncbi:MAG: hypothetical protein A2521_15875 [Deltaproteobacteria bacterium RIFOXYD12_FULL_57_12]|nr:MAG: hypothetical protein A2521_15875 [Deltaproteobacteria bacterium RIFOXYD12_FULL_57_12]
MNEKKKILPPLAAVDLIPGDQKRADHRLLVLLALGFLLLIFHLPDIATPVVSSPNADTQLLTKPVFIWLASHGNDGELFLRQKGSQTDSALVAELFEVLGKVPPSVETVDYTSPAGLYAFQLHDNAEPPDSIVPPARLYPLLFLPVPVNRADKEVLASLPGIGPKLAERIVALRQARGVISRPEDLLLVSGIGPGKLSRLRTLLSYE